MKAKIHKALVADAEKAAEAAMGIQDNSEYSTEIHAKAEQIYELANQISELLRDGKEQ